MRLCVNNQTAFGGMLQQLVEPTSSSSLMRASTPTKSNASGHLWTRGCRSSAASRGRY